MSTAESPPTRGCARLDLAALCQSGLLHCAVCCVVHVHLSSGFMSVVKIEKDFSLVILLKESFQPA